MMDHKTFMKLIPDYMDGTLSQADREAFEAFLATCEECQKAIENYRTISQALQRAAQEAELSDEAQLRLYERFNEERRRRGESLIKIPADLAARVKAKATLAPEAAKKAAQGGRDAAVLATDSSVHLARTTGQSGKRLGRKVKQGAMHAAQNVVDVAKEMGQTIVETGRIVTVDSFQVLREVPRRKRNLLLAPPKLAANQVKAGARLMTGTTKAAAKTVKGGAVMAKDAASVSATGMLESARLGKTMVESTSQMAQAGGTLLQGMKEAAKTIAAEPPANE